MARWFRTGSPRMGRGWVWLCGILVVLVVARLIAPFLIATVVRKSLRHLEGGYRGDIEQVDLSVLRVEVALIGMRIDKTNGRVPVPFLRVRRFVLGTILDGYKPRTTIRLVGPLMNYVDADVEAAEQWGPHVELAQIHEQLPFELARLSFEDGQVHFRNFDARPAVDVRVHELQGSWDRLTGCLPPGWTSCDSTLRAGGRVMSGGTLSVKGRFDRRGGSDFDLVGEIENLKPEEWNAALLKYIKIDAQRGRVDLLAHYHTHLDTKRLVLVPRLHDVKIAGGETERTAWLRELGVGLAAGFFERRQGTKAIAYKSRGAGRGEWSLIDWSPEKERAELHAQELPTSRAQRAR